MKNQCKRHRMKSALVTYQPSHYPVQSKKNDKKDATNLPKVLEIPAADIRKAAFCGWGDFFCSFSIIYV